MKVKRTSGESKQTLVCACRDKIRKQHELRSNDTVSLKTLIYIPMQYVLFFSPASYMYLANKLRVFLTAEAI
jgi:hypothetical protein